MLRHIGKQALWQQRVWQGLRLWQPQHLQASSTAGAATAGNDEPVPQSAPKAALMVIGDELLSGTVSDANTSWLAKLLYSRGVDLERVVFLRDELQDIQDTVLDLKRRVGPDGFVFSSGGIGPTHDDITYEALASVLGVSLQLHEPTVKLMKEHYTRRGMELNEARLRMATLPTPAEVLFTPGLWVPLVQLQGVYILPGIPRLFQQMVSAHQERFTGIAHQSATLFTDLGEGDIADPLAKVAAAHPKVNIGSYPNTQENPQGYKVRLQLQGRDRAAVEAAAEAIRLSFSTFT